MKDSVKEAIEKLAKDYQSPNHLIVEIGDWSKKDLDSFFKNDLGVPLKENKDIQAWVLKAIVKTVALKEESSNPYLILFK